MLRKEKAYSLSNKEKEKIYKFIEEQPGKRYIRPLKLPQIELVFLSLGLRVSVMLYICYILHNYCHKSWSYDHVLQRTS